LILNPSSLPLPSFTGQLHDPDADLLYYRARWYDPTLGKFLNDDPLGFAADDPNVSRYVGNSASTSTDSTGLYDGPEWHHLYVQKYRKYFERIGININDRDDGYLLSTKDHQELTRRWQKEWDQHVTEFDKPDFTNEEKRAAAIALRHKLMEDEQFKIIYDRGARPPVDYEVWNSKVFRGMKVDIFEASKKAMKTMGVALTISGAFATTSDAFAGVVALQDPRAALEYDQAYRAIVDAQLNPDGDGFSRAAEALFGPDPDRFQDAYVLSEDPSGIIARMLHAQLQASEMTVYAAISGYREAQEQYNKYVEAARSRR
jgi:RHS repeat-associated protein